MQPLAQALEFAKYVILFTTFPTPAFHAASVLEWYRRRWQVELVFKRFKSLAQLGHLPRRDDESARAWLYGKLLVALLVEKLIRHARAISPWGYPWETAAAAPRLAQLSVQAAAGRTRRCTALVAITVSPRVASDLREAGRSDAATNAPAVGLLRLARAPRGRQRLHIAA